MNNSGRPGIPYMGSGHKGRPPMPALGEKVKPDHPIDWRDACIWNPSSNQYSVPFPSNAFPQPISYDQVLDWYANPYLATEIGNPNLEAQAVSSQPTPIGGTQQVLAPASIDPISIYSETPRRGLVRGYDNPPLLPGSGSSLMMDSSNASLASERSTSPEPIRRRSSGAGAPMTFAQRTALTKEHQQTDLKRDKKTDQNDWMDIINERKKQIGEKPSKLERFLSGNVAKYYWPKLKKGYYEVLNRLSEDIPKEQANSFKMLHTAKQELYKSIQDWTSIAGNVIVPNGVGEWLVQVQTSDKKLKDAIDVFQKESLKKRDDMKPSEANSRHYQFVAKSKAKIVLDIPRYCKKANSTGPEQVVQEEFFQLKWDQQLYVCKLMQRAIRSMPTDASIQLQAECLKNYTWALFDCGDRDITPLKAWLGLLIRCKAFPSQPENLQLPNYAYPKENELKALMKTYQNFWEGKYEQRLAWQLRNLKQEEEEKPGKKFGIWMEFVKSNVKLFTHLIDILFLRTILEGFSITVTNNPWKKRDELMAIRNNLLPLFTSQYLTIDRMNELIEINRISITKEANLELDKSPDEPFYLKSSQVKSPVLSKPFVNTMLVGGKLYAKKEIPPNSMILEEPLLALKCLTQHSSCEYCHCLIGYAAIPVACGHCIEGVFCTEECRLRAGFHPKPGLCHLFIPEQLSDAVNLVYQTLTRLGLFKCLTFLMEPNFPNYAGDKGDEDKWILFVLESFFGLDANHQNLTVIPELIVDALQLKNLLDATHPADMDRFKSNAASLLQVLYRALHCVLVNPLPTNIKLIGRERPTTSEFAAPADFSADVFLYWHSLALGLAPLRHRFQLACNRTRNVRHFYLHQTGMMYYENASKNSVISQGEPLKLGPGPKAKDAKFFEQHCLCSECVQKRGRAA